MQFSLLSPKIMLEKDRKRFGDIYIERERECKDLEPISILFFFIVFWVVKNGRQ